MLEAILDVLVDVFWPRSWRRRFFTAALLFCLWIGLTILIIEYA